MPNTTKDPIVLASQIVLAFQTIDSRELHPVEPVVVTVTKAGVIRINRDEISDDAFAAKLTRVLAGSGDRTIFFDAHDEAPFGRASKALDLARGAGATTIAVATDTIVKD